MNHYEPADIESTDVEPRTERALTEAMSVLPEGGDIYTVVGENGSTYRVDGREERCTCPDHKHRNAECKHLRRVAFATSDRAVPAEVDGVDELLGEHTDETPRVVASDGGIIEAGDEGEILEEDTDGDERPDDCACWDVEIDVPCWPCYRDGFRSQNPEEPASVEE